MNDQRKVHFSKIEESEYNSLLKKILREKIQIQTWNKDKTQRSDIIPLDVKISEKTIIFDKEDLAIEGEDLLLNINISGMLFFGKAKLKKRTIKQDFEKLVLEKDIYTCERRKNIRVKPNTFNRIKLNITFPPSGQKPENLSKDATIFKQFIALAKQEKKLIFGGKKTFNVFDLSSSGVAILVYPFEKELFERTKFFNDFLVYFNNEVVKIPGADLVYMLEQPNDTEGRIRVAFQYTNMTNELDSDLERRVQSLVDVDYYKNEFEKFLR